MNMKDNKITIIIPLFNEKDNIEMLYVCLKELKSKIRPLHMGIIFIDDGSTDGSLDILKQIAKQDNDTSIISFSRNFGSHAAILAGLRHAGGDAAVILSADLQDPPEIVEKMILQWQNGSNIVWAVRESRKEPFFIKIFSAAYAHLMRKFALSNYPREGVDFCLVDRKVCQFISTQEEKNTNLFGLILWSGYTQSFVSYKREERKKGISKWTFRKKQKLFIDSFVSFSFFPLRLVTYIGFIFSVIALMYIIHLIYNYFKGLPVQGWTTLATLLSGGFAFLFIMLGIMGEYLWRTLDEARKRPSFIIKELVNLREEDR